jgi:hypothetical protein
MFVHNIECYDDTTFSYLKQQLIVMNVHLQIRLPAGNSFKILRQKQMLILNRLVM